MLRLIVVLMLLIPLGVQAEEVMKPGQWKQTIHVTIPGSSSALPSHTSTTCVSAQQAGSIKSIIEAAQQRDCKLNDYSRNGNKAHWKMTCTGKSQASTEGEFTLESKTAYHIHMNALMQTPNGPYKTVVESEGKWVGPCQ